MAAESFFERWGKRAAPPEAPPGNVAPAPVATVATPTEADLHQLAPGDSVAAFVRDGVDDKLKQGALKKLFADPHFNIMDGLDIYIDDYSQPDPMPEAMLRGLMQSRALGLFDELTRPVEEGGCGVADSAEVSVADGGAGEVDSDLAALTASSAAQKRPHPNPLPLMWEREPGRRSDAGDEVGARSPLPHQRERAEGEGSGGE